MKNKTLSLEGFELIFIPLKRQQFKKIENFRPETPIVDTIAVWGRIFITISGRNSAVANGSSQAKSVAPKSNAACYSAILRTIDNIDITNMLVVLKFESYMNYIYDMQYHQVLLI